MKVDTKIRVCQIHGEQPLDQIHWYTCDMGAWTRYRCKLCVKQTRSKQYHRDPEKSKAAIREFRKQNPEKVKFYWHSYLLRHPGKQKELNLKQNKRTVDIRLKVIQHYSRGRNQCGFCGESRIEFLVVDHIKGGGTKHRSKVTGNGVLFYKWVIKNNYPKGYRILCHNCNFVHGMRKSSTSAVAGKLIKDESELTYGGLYYRENAEHLRKAAKVRNNSRRSKQARKLKVMQHYSQSENPHCACCGKTGLEFLSLDHINGGGRKHREKIGNGSMFYSWIVKNNFPNGFRVLCWNCNFAMHKQTCPHQIETIGTVLSI